MMYSIIGGSPPTLNVVSLLEDKICGSFAPILFHATLADLLLISYNLISDGGEGGSGNYNKGITF